MIIANSAIASSHRVPFGGACCGLSRFSPKMRGRRSYLRLGPFDVPRTGYNQSGKVILARSIRKCSSPLASNYFSWWKKCLFTWLVVHFVDLLLMYTLISISKTIIFLYNTLYITLYNFCNNYFLFNYFLFLSANVRLRRAFSNYAQNKVLFAFLFFGCFPSFALDFPNGQFSFVLSRLKIRIEFSNGCSLLLLLQHVIGQGR